MALDREDFSWRDFDLCIGRGKTPVLTLVADATYPDLYRIRYPNGWTSAPANIIRAKEAAYGHARSLLGGQRPVKAPNSAESVSSGAANGQAGIKRLRAIQPDAA